MNIIINIIKYESQYKFIIIFVKKIIIIIIMNLKYES